jgi:Leucine-rich repeat (LRR) protein
VFIENLSHLTNLTQLSIEDNGISSLRGFESLLNLMELCILSLSYSLLFLTSSDIGNNKISDPKEVINLRNLQKLIIIDLAGNPLCISPNYRLYVIYRLARLKVHSSHGLFKSRSSMALALM